MRVSRQQVSNLLQWCLEKNISGSIEGDAIQNDITGASGTPLIKRELITGITPHEQKGLNAPTAVARNTERRGFFPNILPMFFDSPERFIITASGMVTSRYGQMWRNELRMNSEILISCSMIQNFKSVFLKFYTIDARTKKKTQIIFPPRYSNSNSLSGYRKPFRIYRIDNDSNSATYP